MAEPIILTRGVPADESFDIDSLVSCAEDALRRHGKKILQYHPARGLAALREVIADWETVPVERVLLGNGSLQLFDLLIRTTLSPGDTVLVERPTYDRVITALRRAGCQVYGVPVDRQGMDIHALQEQMERHTPRMIYTIPDFQNPTGATMSADRRERMMELVTGAETLLVADLPYRPLRYWGHDEPSLSSYGSSSLVQMSSFSKLISPGMRVGWMTAPQTVIDSMAGLAETSSICPGMLSQGIVYEFVRQGVLERTVERLKRLYAPRLQACLRALSERLPEAEWIAPEGGFFLGLTLPSGISARALRSRVLELGVTLSDGEGFFPDGDGSRFVRIPFCGVNPSDIETAIARIGEAVRGNEESG